ncbi:MAG: GUN4 domain-containing protein [Geitlerinemataceae cyanobacterium]
MSDRNFSPKKHWKSWVGVIVLLSLSVQSCQLKGEKIQKVDYTSLAQQLKAKNWRSADAETLQLILKISDRTDEGWLDRSDVEKLDCNTLLQIDRLWEKQSQGQFGFNPQRLIWLSVGGKVGEYAPEIAEKFGDRVGWRTQGKWQDYNTLDFSLQAPKGHLPATTGNGVSGSVWGGVAAIGQRLQECRSQVPISVLRNEYYTDCDRRQNEHRCRLKEAAERWGETPDWEGEGLPKLVEELEQALAQQQWIEADKITKTLLDRYRQANLAEFHDSDSHELIPCYLLEAVDDRWMHYSQGRFGLSAQTSILSEIKLLSPNRKDPSIDSIDSFRKAVGWSQFHPSRFEDTYKLEFDAVDPRRVPKGYYPYDIGYSYYTYGSGYYREWRLNFNPACGFNG